MLSTIVAAVLLVGLLIGSLVLWMLFLRLGLRWARIPNVTTRQIVLATSLVTVLQGTLNTCFLFISASSDAQSIVLALVNIGAAVAVPCCVISTVFKARFLRAFQAWLPTLLSSVMMTGFVYLVLRPFIYEAFVLPANAMAPTLVGRHWQGTCSQCGRPNYCSPTDEHYVTADPPLMICDSFHVTQPANLDYKVHASDRFMVARFLNPRRWDLVVFRYPEDPTIMYVKRLVGLPGEKVHIEDGSVWINGERQTPPDSLRNIRYLSELPDWYGPELWGSLKRPALLGQDEYFVLGDFSAQSKDSRLWEQGAPDHNPFAVPRSHLKGVVTHTYWPPRRWRIHR
jgi:signal peptidase I